MKAVFQEYGTVILAAVVGLGIMALIFGLTLNGRKGVGQIAGGVLEQQTKDSLIGGSSTPAYEAYAAASAEEIRFDSGKTLYSGRRVRVDEHFTARGSDGSTLAVKVLGLRDSEGRALSVVRENGAEYVTFARPGIYRIYLRAGSETAREREAVIAFPVEQG